MNYSGKNKSGPKKSTSRIHGGNKSRSNIHGGNKRTSGIHGGSPSTSRSYSGNKVSPNPNVAERLKSPQKGFPGPGRVTPGGRKK